MVKQYRGKPPPYCFFIANKPVAMQKPHSDKKHKKVAYEGQTPPIIALDHIKIRRHEKPHSDKVKS